MRESNPMHGRKQGRPSERKHGNTRWVQAGDALEDGGRHSRSGVTALGSSGRTDPLRDRASVEHTGDGYERKLPT
jgi:hypothetical protein